MSIADKLTDLYNILKEDAVNSLTDIVDNLLNNDRDVLVFHEHDIHQIIRNESDCDQLTETYSGVCIDDNGLYFTVDTYNEGYTVSAWDVDLDTIIAYIYELEELEVTNG